MLRFVIRKMLNKKWMVLSLLIGNILLVSIAAGNPMYMQAALQRTLTRRLGDYLTTRNAYPGTVTLRAGSSASRNGLVFEAHEAALAMPAAFDLPAIEQVAHFSLAAARIVPAVERDDVKNKSIALGSLSDLPAHVELVAGRMYAQEPDEDGVIEVIVSERGLIEMHLLLGEVFSFPTVLDAQGEEVTARLVGVFRNAAPDDPYWVRSPSGYGNVCFLAEPLFASTFMAGETQANAVSGTWYVLLDYAQMRTDAAARILQVAQGYQERFASASSQNYRDNFSAILTEYLKTAKKVEVTLWILQAPIFVLLAAFIFMVARQMLEMEQNEIAVIKSRGAGRGQIFLMYLLQSVLLGALGVLLGLPLGVYLCQVLGSANAFLEFVRRSALPVEMGRQALLFALAAALFSVLAMVLPVIRFSRTTIVSHKARKQRRGEAPLWQRLFLDVALLGVALYGLYAFDAQKEYLAQRVLDGASLDPLLFLSSSLFMIGAGLVALRVIPLMVWLVFALFRRWWSPAMYASFLRVLRTRASQGFIMVFLVITIALGVFNAQAARTINRNAEDNLFYGIGADLVLREVWEDNSAQVAEDSSMELMYVEPDFGRYLQIEGPDSIARVLTSDAITMSVPGGTLKNVRLMGIETDDFGRTAWFKDSLTDIHWHHYLNAISQNGRAVLVSRNFHANYGYKLGDAITYRNAAGDSARGIIYGFVDYFPTYAPVTYLRGGDGIYQEVEHYLIVAHLGQLQSSWGVTPYEIWLSHSGSSQFIYDFAAQNNVQYAVFKDSAAQLVALKNDPVLQGTNGVLTVGFIVVLLLCAVGFLIYWVLSIQSRALQFGIFRAMGMTMREVITMLLNEQVCISGLSIATGALVGGLTAKLYMPLIQLAYAASDNAIPLAVISERADMLRLMLIVAIMILICMAILGALISRMKIAQALKLGED